MEYYGGQLCISARELVDGGIVTESNYRNWTNRKLVHVVRRGGGSKGQSALVVIDSLPAKYRALVDERFPGGAAVRLRGWILSNYELDQNAVAYFMKWSSEQPGNSSTADTAMRYAVNASVLNCCITLYNRAATARRLMGEKYDWGMMSATVETLRAEFGHDLPASTLRFRKKVNDYKRHGYGSLISGKFGNQASRKVDHKTERLIISLATLPNKPFNTNVWEMYNSFVCGELDVWDYETGELLNPDEWTDKNGEPVSLSESTITNYLNLPKNRVLIEKSTTSYTTFMHGQMPHVHRHAPEFSFSKISFDDRDLPRKLADTKIRPKAYYAYDVASQCVVGYAYNRYKNIDLVTDCFRSMFRLIERNGWGCPAQVEVENHLMSQWRDSFLQAGVLFPFVRFCAPMNSQEKYAEPLNGAKKRSIEHKNHLGIGRFYAKNRAYRTESKKVFDERNDTYEDKQYYTWDELIADDIRDIKEFNSSLHPNQKKYPGMTRRQVLEANMNPNLQPMDKPAWARFIGEKVPTTIRRNSYCRVAYKDWWLSKTEVIEKLEPNNRKVDAYYLTNEDGEITDMYIFQNDRLIDRLEDVGTFNTADAEQTDEDRDIFVAQQKKIAGFNSYVSRNAIRGVGVAKAEPADELPAEAIELPPVEGLPETMVTYHVPGALESL